MLANAPIMASIPCVDLAGAREFYGQTLGLVEMEDPAADEGPPAVIYQCGQATMLLVYQRATPTKADHTAAGWIVEDVDAAADFLISKGVKLLIYDMPEMQQDERGVASLGSVKTAWFSDPEGNILSIAQMP